MAAAVLEITTKYLQRSNREARLILAGIIALFTGYVSQQGMPGSVVVIGIAVLFAALVAAQFKPGWTRPALVMAAFNGVALLAVALEPGPLNLSVMWFSLAGFSQMQQGVLPTDILLLAKTSLRSLGKAPFGFIREMRIIRGIRNRSRLHPRLVTLANILLPLVAIGIFGLLLVIANPLIESAVTRFSWGDSLDFLLSWMPVATIVAFLLSRAVVSARPVKNETTLDDAAIWLPQYFMPGPVIVTLLALNGMFLVENLLDLQYVWSGIALPAGMNYAEYVHRGSYTLIATAILAGALIIFALQPGSRGEASPPVRWLVYLWTFQNVFLVASSAKRTLSYVDAYGMTLWRLSGLIWMGLITAGLIFVAARVIAKRSNLWLMNVNLGTAFTVLLICGLLDFRGFVADWNVKRALVKIDPANSFANLDIDPDYLFYLGPSALLSIHRLRNAAGLNPKIWIGQNRVSFVAYGLINRLSYRLLTEQSDWKTWTLRGAWIERASGVI